MSNQIKAISEADEAKRLAQLSLSDGASDASEEDSRTLTILYSTETGNAQDVAERLGREGERWRWDVQLIDAEDFDINTLLSAPIILFVLSTTGNGEHNKTFRPLWQQLLNSTLPPALLDGLSYGVFGLGDSSYPMFNWAAKSLDRRLESLGAQRLVQRGDGDERHYMGYDGVFLPWAGVLFNVLNSLLPMPSGVSKLPDSYLPPPRVRLVFRDGAQNDSGSATGSAIGSKTQSSPNECKLRSSRRLTDASWWQEVRHLTFTTPPRLNYKAGDVAVLQPSNNPDDISALLRQLGWEACADSPLTLNDERGRLPHTLHQYTHSPTTLRSLLIHHLSPYAVPRTTFFEYLAHFAGTATEKDRLREFISTDGADDLYEYCTRVRRTAAEVLCDFKSVRVPPAYVLDVFPLLRPRKFSIASACDGRSLELCIALVRYKTKLVKPRIGICSAWLERLQDGNEVQIGIEEGTIRAPDVDTPLLLVGPGTGVAPMRALVQERLQAGAKETALYFGCRCSGMDELYCEEFANRHGLHYRVAHSRDDKEGNKEYVQHLLQADGRRVYSWLVERQGYLFISGSSGQMPKGVKRAIASVVERLEGVSEKQAKEKVEHLERSGRIVEECW